MCIPDHPVKKYLLPIARNQTKAPSGFVATAESDITRVVPTEQLISHA
jgi:hypothetical protein